MEYCRFWRRKLDDGEDVEFPEVLDKAIARITEGFSFAYMQEAFVASLLAIAGMAEDSDDPGSSEDGTDAETTPRSSESLQADITWYGDLLQSTNDPPNDDYIPECVGKLSDQAFSALFAAMRSSLEHFRKGYSATGTTEEQDEIIELADRALTKVMMAEYSRMHDEDRPRGKVYTESQRRGLAHSLARSLHNNKGELEKYVLWRQMKKQVAILRKELGQEGIK